MSMPYFGREFTFYQPDGTPLRVTGFGNQDNAVFETLDGYTVVRNAETGFYEYAMLNKRGDLVPTGYQAKKTPPKKLGLKRHLRSKRREQETPEVTMAAAEPYQEKPRWQMRRMERRAAAQASAASVEVAAAAVAPLERQKIGNFVGLCLLIDFPDVPGTIPREEVEAYCNHPGYNGFGNNGSVLDYFLENSNGLLSYTSIVAPYYTALHERSYYTDPTQIYPRRAVELLREALDSLKLQDIDLSSLSVDNQQCVYATNVFYASGNTNGFRLGLYPHTGVLSPRHELLPGQLIADYQFTDMGSELTLGTFCHENGHLICDFPDLYDLTPDGGRFTHGVGKFCLMGYGGYIDEKNPAQIGAYLKYRAGWANSVTEITTGLHSSVRAGVNDFYIFKKDEQEYFIIENRQKVGRDRALPGGGLAIWHVDESGSNNFQQMTPEQHYECSLEQADGLFDLERAGDAGQAKDLFHGGGTTSFGDATTPDSRWWDGSPSGLNISNISNNGPIMSFFAEV
ncbi:MAG TPA: M6 family metalloprotease domain-containing protein [Pyrinomonadaceae bacterium]|nr:M6 family metalloprotease domain-containing protein [Pyrinomonadaceae bacterium]